MIFVLFILSIGSFFLVAYDWEVVLLLFFAGGGQGCYSEIYLTGD